MSRRKVCLFGTSANPPTGEGGHLGIATALTKLGVFDEIRILPVFRHMFAEKRNPEQPSFQDRIEMCRLGFKDLPKVTVSDQEEKCFQWAAKQKNITKPSEIEKFRVGTADLLDMLIENESNTDFTMAMGSDTFKDLVDQKWKRSDDIIKLLNGRIVVFVRKFNNDKNTNDGTNEQLQFENVNEKMLSDLKQYIDKLNQKFLDSEDDIEMKKNKPKNTSPVKLLEVPSLTSISSTSIRSTTAENIDKLQKALHPDVVEYIMKNKMYGFSISD